MCSEAPSACHLGRVLGGRILKQGNCSFMGEVEEELGSVSRSVASRKRKRSIKSPGSGMNLKMEKD